MIFQSIIFFSKNPNNLGGKKVGFYSSKTGDEAPIKQPCYILVPSRSYFAGKSNMNSREKVSTTVKHHAIFNLDWVYYC